MVASPPRARLGPHLHARHARAERRARLDELASDLWEHLDHAVATGRRRARCSSEIAGRTARGAAADVAWRFTHRSGPLSLTTLRGPAGSRSRPRRRSSSRSPDGGAPVLGVYRVESWAPGEAREFARSWRRCSSASSPASRCSGAAPRRRGARRARVRSTRSTRSGMWPISFPARRPASPARSRSSRRGRAPPARPDRRRDADRGRRAQRGPSLITRRSRRASDSRAHPTSRAGPTTALSADDTGQPVTGL